jgi:ornithine cyclodeaminase
VEELLFLGRAEIRALLPMSRCVDLMADALADLARGLAVNPLRSALPIADGRGILAMMPGGASGAFGAKVISVFPGNRAAGLESHQGLVVLFESEHGRPMAILDASEITAIRTAAVSGVATRTLAPSDAGDLAIIGSGTQARTHLEAMQAVRKLTRVRAWSPTRARLVVFADGARDQLGLEVEPMPSARAAIDGAQIVCTVSGATEPVLEGEWLAPGTHVNAVGSSVASAREVDAEAVRRARLFVDRRESAMNESGDLLGAIREGVVDASHISAELGDVLIGSAEGRRTRDEITLFESLGLAVEDLAAAAFVVAAAREKGVGTPVAF